MSGFSHPAALTQAAVIAALGTTANPQFNSIGIGQAPFGTTGSLVTSSFAEYLGAQILGGGLVDSGFATVSAPIITSGVAFTPNATFTTLVQIDLAATTLGSLKVTFGPTTGAENTWLPTANVVAGSDIVSTLWVPNGWLVIATATGVTVALSASVLRI